MTLRQWLMDPSLVRIDVDTKERIVRHREILLRKKMTRDVFFELYKSLETMDERFLSAAGARIEIGAGSSLIKDLMPDVETTDLVPYDGLDRVVDAMSMPYEDNTLRTIFAVHCFHHLPDPYKFLSELERTCAPGGGAVIIEPYYGPVASFLYKRLFSNEYFDKNGSATTAYSGPMSEANQALSYIVFNRERKYFNLKHPNLEIVHSEPLTNYIRYLCSGGVNFRQLLPNFSIPALQLAEGLLSPLASFLALHQIIVLRKKGN